jgi:hypothetical protein
MIISALMLLVFNTINALLVAIPSVSSTNPFITSVHVASGYMGGLNVILPIDTILQILVFYVVFEAAYLLFKVIYWIIRRFPTQS